MRQRLALVFLVLLRMAIGWHFGFEGYEKKKSVDRDPSYYNNYKQPWSSEQYFQEGNGPLAKLIKSRIGDPDDTLLARLTPPDRQMPERLDKEWDEYLEKFAKHYALAPDQQEAARQALPREKAKTVEWLTARPGSIHWFLSGQWTDIEHTPFKRTYPGGAYEVDISVADRVAEYRQKLVEYRDLSGTRSYTMRRDVEKAHRPAVRGELMALRAELQALLDKRTDEMKKSLADAALTKEQKTLPPVPPPEKHWLIRYIDTATIWGLLAIGVCLMLGFFSRAAAMGGALFLVMTLLTHPPVPWYPEPPNTEGHYVFISKNVIEMLALFMLACIPTGRWFGIDAIIHALNPFRKTEEE